MHSSRGDITPGSSRVTPASLPRPAGCWTCTPGCSRVRSWEQMSTSSARTRRPPSRRAAAATPPCRRPRPGCYGSSTNTSAGGRWPIWPPGMSTRPACSAAASPPPASSRSAGWSPRVMTTEPHAFAERVYWRLADTDHPSDLHDQRARVADHRHVDKRCTVGEPIRGRGCSRQGEPGLAHPRRSGQGKEPGSRRGENSGQRGQLGVAADQRSGRQGQRDCRATRLRGSGCRGDGGWRLPGGHDPDRRARALATRGQPARNVAPASILGMDDQ